MNGNNINQILNNLRENVLNPNFGIKQSNDENKKSLRAVLVDLIGIESEYWKSSDRRYYSSGDVSYEFNIDFDLIEEILNDYEVDFYDLESDLIRERELIYYADKRKWLTENELAFNYIEEAVDEYGLSYLSEKFDMYKLIDMGCQYQEEFIFRQSRVKNVATALLVFLIDNNSDFLLDSMEETKLKEKLADVDNFQNLLDYIKNNYIHSILI